MTTRQLLNRFTEARAKMLVHSHCAILDREMDERMRVLVFRSNELFDIWQGWLEAKKRNAAIPTSVAEIHNWKAMSEHTLKVTCAIEQLNYEIRHARLMSVN